MTRRNYPLLACLTLAFSLACDAKKNETPAQPAPEPGPAQVQGAATAPVVDKLTCPAGCTQMSRTEPVPRCCQCGGREGSWKKSTFSATTWLCQG